MLDRVRTTLHACKGVYQRRDQLFRKLIRHPFFPILFIGETIKTAVIVFAKTGVVLAPHVLALALAAAVVTLVWVFAEHLLDEVSEEIEEVTNNE